VIATEQKAEDIRAGQLEYARNEGIDIGHAQGHAEGERMERLRAVRAGMVKGYPLEMIADVNDLPLDEVIELAGMVHQDK